VRRQGLASVLVAEVARRIQARGDTPCLHVATTNVAALPVYDKLGFRERRLITFRAVRRPV
jgi:predicted GNAT family acetyltransferase